MLHQFLQLGALYSFFFNDITAKGNSFVCDSLNADLMRVSFTFFYIYSFNTIIIFLLCYF